MCPFEQYDQHSEPKCGNIAEALSVIGDKWTGKIIRDLTAGPKRFTQLEQSLGIGPRTLSQRLDSLEARHIIVRRQYAESPPRTDYRLTQKGEDLLPILQSMADWGAKYRQAAAPDQNTKNTM